MNKHAIMSSTAWTKSTSSSLETSYQNWFPWPLNRHTLTTLHGRANWCGRLPFWRDGNKLLQSRLRKGRKITNETTNSFRHMITLPLNAMMLNSLYFAVLQVKNNPLQIKQWFIPILASELEKKFFRCFLLLVEKLQHFRKNKCCAWNSSQKSPELYENTSRLIGNSFNLPFAPWIAINPE